ncbi:MAG: hypothetical protein ACI8RZ_008006 [Myxococcota bacterium]|jgi:hypothetical protein
MSDRVAPGEAGSVPRGPEVHMDEVGEGRPGVGSGAPVAEGEVVSVGAEARSPQSIDPDPSDRSTKAAFRRFCRQRRAEKIAEVAEGRAARCQVPEFRHDEGGRQPERFVKLRLIQGGGDKDTDLGLEGKGSGLRGDAVFIHEMDIHGMDISGNRKMNAPGPDDCRADIEAEASVLLRRLSTPLIRSYIFKFKRHLGML